MQEYGSEALQSTIMYCTSGPDGSLSPAPDRHAEVRRQFRPGMTIADRYHLGHLLGAGGMGCVFRATDLRLDRPVAMKVVRRKDNSASEAEADLQKEARIGAGLSHQGLASVYDFGLANGASFTIFEYIEGKTLRELLHSRKRLSLEETCGIISDLAAALDYAHLHSLVHRDLKPENICFTKAGKSKILDLGLAYQMNVDVVNGYSGTPAYSSPEQADCQHTDGRTDQYALGLIAFEMLTGQRVFQAGSPQAMLLMHLEKRPPLLRDLLPDMPRHAERAIERALNKHPDDRFATCTRFAGVLGEEIGNSPGGHSLLTSVTSRVSFYIAHAAEESLLARQLANDLQRCQFSSWYYGRDALPGVPFFGQAMRAIEHSQAAIFLVSRAILSTDLHRELEFAYRIQCPILPILVDLSRAEFETLAPSWCRMLEPSGTIEYRGSEPLSGVTARITSAAEILGITGGQSTQQKEPSDVRKCAGQTWATDANHIDIMDLDRVLFRTDAIDDFLISKHRHFICATKGFGKTLILTCKRALLTGQDSKALTMVPEGRPYLDFMSELRTLSSKYGKTLSDLANTKRFWNMALRISAISHSPSVVSDKELSEVRALPDRIQRWIQGRKVQPSIVFKELVTVSISELNRLIDQTENFLDLKTRQIHGGLCFFIDKVDQAVRHLPKAAWISVQAGLIEAAWETMNANSHVKVFASIRQEAFVNYRSDIKANLFSATTILNYSESELRSLLDQLAGCYEGLDSFVDFLGHNVLRHGQRPAPEDSFQFVRRHTLGRPRDMVALASNISAYRDKLNEKQLRQVVQQTSSDVLASNVFNEVIVFLSCLGDEEARQRFLDLLPGNILERSDAFGVCEAFNGLAPGSLQHFGEDSNDIFHPFQDLYFAGLLGVVNRDPDEGVAIQRFRNPHDAMTYASVELPDSEVYLLHPALDVFIRQRQRKGTFLQFQHIPVGENLPWDASFSTILQIEKALVHAGSREFTEAAQRMVKRLQTLLASERTPITALEVRRSPEWEFLLRHQGQEDACDAVLWLSELLEQVQRT